MNNKGFSKEGREEWYKTMIIYRFMANYNLAGDMAKSNACFDLLAERCYFKTAFENFVHKHYGFYGATEMKFIYEDVTREEYEASLMSYLRKRFKTVYPFDLPDIPKGFDGPNDIPLTLDEIAELSETNKFYFSHLQKSIRIFATEWCAKYSAELAQKRYPGLTTQLSKMYVRMRKWTHYAVDLCDSNDVIVDAFWNESGQLFSWETINHLKRIFGYPEEPEYSENYIQKKAVNKARRKEELEAPFLEFMENTGLRKISITKLEKELDLTFDTQTSFNKEEFDCIKKWFMSCKKARTCNGYFGKVPDSLVRSYNCKGHDLLVAVLSDISKFKDISPVVKTMAAEGLKAIA